MAKKQESPSKLHAISLLRSSVETIFANPLIFYPYCFTAFLQLLVLEILFFAPRYPLSTFFGPIVKKIWSETFLHYPFNLVLLPKIFQYAQIPIYLLISSFMIGVSIAIIAAINGDRKITFGQAVRQCLGQYVHIVVAAILIFLTYYGFYYLYELLVQRAQLIRSETGIFHLLKVLIIGGAPYVNLVQGVFVSALFAFVFPLIVLERRKVFTAVVVNFKYLWRSFWFIFLVILIPTLFYLPVLLLRNNITALSEGFIPSLRIFVLVFSVLTMIIIDAIVYTSITIYFLLKQENK